MGVMGTGRRYGAGGHGRENLVTSISFCSEPSLPSLVNTEQLVPLLASEQLSSVSSFSALGRGTGPLRKCLMGWKGWTKQARSAGNEPHRGKLRRVLQVAGESEDSGGFDY